MLITNFSAGELSENLYGRTDIEQYYSAASYLENFDVIPTGGIKNRLGTKKILNGFKDNDGRPLAPVRIVPFVMSRDEAYLVVFCHEKIAVYAVGEWDAPKAVFTNEDIAPGTLYASGEIPLVQHAQNGRTMVTAHKNHPPLEIYFFPGSISISVFYISYMVKQVHSPNVLPKFSPKNDETYEVEETYENIYLKRPGQYPGCVTFFNGRIVFASTEMKSQRLFFSRVNNVHDFSTKKSYITEKKEYIAVKGRIIHGSSTIVLESDEEAEKIIAAPDKYIVDSRFFDPGTRLLSVPFSENSIIQLHVSNPAKLSGSTLDQNQINQIKADLASLESEFNSQNESKPHVENYIAGIARYNTGQIVSCAFYIKFGISKAVLRVHSEYGFSTNAEESFEIDSFSAGRIDNGTIDAYLENLIKYHIGILSAKIPDARGTPQYIGKNGGGDVTGGISRVINAWKTIISAYMKYQHTGLNGGNPYYNYMPDIKSQVESSFVGLAKSVYIPLYTTEQIKDDYPTADDGFTFEVASDRNDEIRWMVQNKNIIVGTESAEYVIPSNINAVNVSAFLNSFYGSSKMQASSAGDAVLFFRDGQKGLVEYHIPEADSYFRTNDLMMMSPQMLSESEAVDFDVVTMPHTMLVVTRADGKLATLLYDRSFGVFAWGRVALGSGNAKSLAVIPGKSGYDDIYLLVEKDANCCLELLEEGGKAYLDSYKQWDGNRTGYADDAVIYDEAENKVYPLTGELPEASEKRFIGYPYTSRIKSMPIITNNKMKPCVIKNLLVRFADSYEPKIKSYPGGHVDVFFFEKKAPYTGVEKIMFPGSWDRDVMFEFFHEKPTRCKILSIYAEVN